MATPELAFLLGILDGNITEPVKSHDWATFLSLTDHHRLAPIVSKTLSDFKNVPQEIRLELAHRRHKKAAHTLILSKELIRLAKEFEEGGIPLLSLKGPLLAYQAYGDLSMRESKDLDLLVHREHLNEAHKMLSKNYQLVNPAFTLTPRQAAHHIRWGKDATYVHKSLGVAVELHWKLIENGLLNLSASQIWEKSTTTDFFGQAVRHLDDEHNFFYLCVHGAKHNWFRLFWLNDVIQLLKKNPSLPNQAKFYGCEKAVAEAMLLISCLSQANHPLVAGAKTNVKERPLRLISSWPGKFLYALNRLHPTTDDWRTIRIPDRFFWLYFVLRPFMAFRRAYASLSVR